MDLVLFQRWVFFSSFKKGFQVSVVLSKEVFKKGEMFVVGGAGDEVGVVEGLVEPVFAAFGFPAAAEFAEVGLEGV